MKKSTLLYLGICFLNFYSTSQIENGMIAHFPFNNNISDISESSVITINNGLIQFTDDRNDNPNLGIDFSNNSYITFNDNNVKVGFPVTISVWVKVNSFSKLNVIFRSDNIYDHYYGYWMNISKTTGKVTMNMSGGFPATANVYNRRTFETDNSIELGVWTHIVGVIRDYNDMDIRIDCVDQSGSYSGTGQQNIVYSSASSRIGSATGDNWDPQDLHFNGSMDQLIIWNRELTVDEIQTVCDIRNTLNINKKEISVTDYGILYPNPASQIVNIDLEGNKGDYSLHIYDVSGRYIESHEYNNTEFIIIDIEKYTSGIYYIQLENKTGEPIFFKLLVEK